MCVPQSPTDDSFYIRDTLANFVKKLKEYRGTNPKNFAKSDKHDDEAYDVDKPI